MTLGTWPQVARRSIAGLLLGLLPVMAHAQAPGQRRHRAWTIEVVGGGGTAVGAANGPSTVEFPDGQPFVTRDGLPSRRVSSWHFGDGTELFNAALARFEEIQGRTFPRLVPLDAAFRDDVAAQRGGASIGVRVGRQITSAIAIDLLVERRRMPLAFTDPFSSALSRTADAFQSTFHALLATAPISELSVNSGVSVAGSRNHQTRLTGALRWTFRQGRRVSGFVTVGAGAELRGGGTPTATLTGRYEGLLNRLSPFQQTDTVTVVLRQPRAVPVGTFAVGVTHTLGSRFGLRADATVSVSGGSRDVLVRATPVNASSGATGVVASLTTPAIQFNSVTAHPSSLSGPPMEMTTSSGRGTPHQLSFTLGVFRRF